LGEEVRLPFIIPQAARDRIAQVKLFERPKNTMKKADPKRPVKNIFFRPYLSENIPQRVVVSIWAKKKAEAT
jgi:hypothetical protein